MIMQKNLSLILPGQSEHILQAVIESRTTDKETAQKLEAANRKNKIQDRKLAYANNFVERVAKYFKVKKESVPRLLENFSNEDLLKIDQAIVKNLRPRAFLQILGINAWLSAVIFSTIFIPGSFLWFLLFFSSLMGILPVIVLFLSFSGLENGGVFLNNYLISRNRLKNQYGSTYFPYQELSKVLGSEGKTGGD